MGMARTRGWTVEERDVMPEELSKASEVFLCGSAAEIVPVGSIDQHHFQAGPVAKTLMPTSRSWCVRPTAKASARPRT